MFLDVVSFTPDFSKLPGAGTIQDLTNGIGAWMLAVSLVALLLSGGSWAIGTVSGNIHVAGRGKVGSVIAAGAALLIGAASLIINWAYSIGHGLH